MGIIKMKGDVNAINTSLWWDIETGIDVKSFF